MDKSTEDIIIEIKDMIAELQRSNEYLTALLEEQHSENALLKEQVAHLTKKLYGRSGEKKKDIPGQLNLFDQTENVG